MKGHIRQRGAHSWELKFDAGRDSATGNRKIQYRSFRGTKREAQLKLAELIASIGGGSYVEPSKVTVAEFVRSRVDQWEASGDISARTAQRYRQLVENQMVPHIGDKPLQKLRPLDMEEWHSALRAGGRADGKGGVSARTIGHAHRILSKALGEATRNEMVARNTAKMQSVPKVIATQMEIVQDVPHLLERLRGERLRAPAVLALFSGMRLGEVLALRWSRVDLDRKVVEVREALEATKIYGIRMKAPKSRAGVRDIALPDVAVEVLREHRRNQLELRMQLGAGKLADDALVFPTFGGEPQWPGNVSSDWGDTAARCGIAGVTFHGLRHTHASQLLKAGVDIVTVAKRLGHADPSITLRIYAHVFKDSDAIAAAAINKALGGL